MDEDKKKRVMLVIIVVCMSIVAIMTIARMRKPDKDKIPEFEGQVEWVLCRNTACGTNYSIPMKNFHEQLQKIREPGSPVLPPLVCEKCGEGSIYRAVKCVKCELVFEPGSIYQIHGDPRDYSDRCPKCNHSKREEDRGVKYTPKKR